MAKGVIIPIQEKLINLTVTTSNDIIYYEDGDIFDISLYTLECTIGSVSSTGAYNTKAVTINDKSQCVIYPLILRKPGIKPGPETIKVTITYFYEGKAISTTVDVNVEQKLKPWGECSWQDIYNICQMRQGDSESNKIISKEHFNNWIQIGYEKDLALNYQGSERNVKSISDTELKLMLPYQLKDTSSNWPDTVVPNHCVMEVKSFNSDKGQIIFISKYILYFTRYTDNNTGPLANQCTAFTEDCHAFYKAMMINREWLIKDTDSTNKTNRGYGYYVTLPIYNENNKIKKYIQSISKDYDNTKEYYAELTAPYLTTSTLYRSDGSDNNNSGGFVPEFIFGAK